MFTSYNYQIKTVNHFINSPSTQTIKAYWNFVKNYAGLRTERKYHPFKVTIQLAIGFTECDVSLIGTSTTVPKIFNDIV